MMPPLSKVQQFEIAELGEMWQREFGDVPLSLIIRELRHGWYKWVKANAGVEGYSCGKQLEPDQFPAEADLPPVSQRVGREFIVDFARAEGWTLPALLRDGEVVQAPAFAGRPSISAAILHELRRLGETSELLPTCSAQAQHMIRWATPAFPGEQVPKQKSMENVIRAEYNRLRRQTLTPSNDPTS